MKHRFYYLQNKMIPWLCFLEDKYKQVDCVLQPWCVGIVGGHKRMNHRSNNSTKKSSSFFLTETKAIASSITKKERVAQLIYGKSDENHYKLAHDSWRRTHQQACQLLTNHEDTWPQRQDDKYTQHDTTSTLLYSLRPKILVLDLSKYGCIKSRFSIRYIRI